MSECSCQSCTNACRYRPGYFAPGEPQKAAEFLGLTVQEFFKKYLLVDFQTDHTGFKVDYYLLMPAVVGREGMVAEFSPDRGRCVFLTPDGKCGIHPVKPLECRIYDHTVSRTQAETNHTNITKKWIDHQEEVFEALGRHLKRKKFPRMSHSALWFMLHG